MALDVDFVSDLNGTGDTTVAVHGNDIGQTVDTQRTDNVRVPAATKVAAEPTPAETAADKPKSLRDQISSALKGGENTPPAATQDGKVRNPDGTFAPKPAVDPAAAAAAAPAAQVDPAAARPLAAPHGIDPEVFKTLPAETQASLARTMDDLAQRQQRFGRLEQMEQVLGPRRQAWALNGMSETQAVNQLLALSDFATRDATGFVKWFSQNNGVNLEELVLGQEPVDPKYSALEKQIAELQTARTMETQQQKQAAHTQTVNSVIAFASEKGPEGQPLRPYFDQLGQDVLPMISAVKAQNPNWSNAQVLQEAYDRACWASPSVRGKMQEALNAKAEAERLRQGVDKVDRARTASVSVKSGTPANGEKAPNDNSRSLRDTIKASMAAAG